MLGNVLGEDAPGVAVALVALWWEVVGLLAGVSAPPAALQRGNLLSDDTKITNPFFYYFFFSSFFNCHSYPSPVSPCQLSTFSQLPDTFQMPARLLAAVSFHSSVPP